MTQYKYINARVITHVKVEAPFITIFAKTSLPLVGIWRLKLAQRLTDKSRVASYVLFSIYKNSRLVMWMRLVFVASPAYI